MKTWGWQNGRQIGCEYKKFPLYKFKLCGFGFDAYILKYNADSVLPEHTDPVEGGKHWRMNIGWGIANFVCEDYEHGVFKRWRKLSVNVFRPDLYKHSLYVFGDTIKLSFGFVKFKKL